MAGTAADVTPTTQWACLPRGRATPARAQDPAAAPGDRVQETHTATIRAKQRAVRESNALAAAAKPATG